MLRRESSNHFRAEMYIKAKELLKMVLSAMLVLESRGEFHGDFMIFPAFNLNSVSRYISQDFECPHWSYASISLLVLE